MNLSIMPKNEPMIAKRISIILEKLGSLMMNKIETNAKKATKLTLIICVASEKIFLQVLRGLYKPKAKYKIKYIGTTTKKENKKQLKNPKWPPIGPNKVV